MKYLYDVLDTDTGEHVVESGTSADVENAIGIEKRRIAMYVKTGNKFHRRYLIEIMEQPLYARMGQGEKKGYGRSEECCQAKMKQSYRGTHRHRFLWTGSRLRIRLSQGIS